MINPSLSGQGSSSDFRGPMNRSEWIALENARKIISSASSNKKDSKKKSSSDNNPDYEDVGVGKAILAGLANGVLPEFVRDGALFVYDKIREGHADRGLTAAMNKWEKEGIKGDELTKKITEWKKEHAYQPRKKWRYKDGAKWAYNLTKYGSMIGTMMGKNYYYNTRDIEADKDEMRKTLGLNDKVDLHKVMMYNKNTGEKMTGSDILQDEGLSNTFANLVMPSWARTGLRQGRMRNAFKNYKEVGAEAKRLGISEKDLLKELAKPVTERNFNSDTIDMEEPVLEISDINNTDISHNNTKGEVKVPKSEVPDYIEEDYLDGNELTSRISEKKWKEMQKAYKDSTYGYSSINETDLDHPKTYHFDPKPYYELPVEKTMNISREKTVTMDATPNRHMWNWSHPFTVTNRIDRMEKNIPGTYYKVGNVWIDDKQYQKMQNYAKSFGYDKSVPVDDTFKILSFEEQLPKIREAHKKFNKLAAKQGKYGTQKALKIILKSGSGYRRRKKASKKKTTKRRKK